MDTKQTGPVSGNDVDVDEVDEGGQLYAVEDAVDVLVNVDSNMSERVEAAQRLAEAFGLDWPRGIGGDDEDEDLGGEGIAP